MKEIDILKIMVQGWASNPDPVAGADMSFLPDVENFAPTKENAVELAKGWADYGGAAVLTGAVTNLFGIQLKDGSTALVIVDGTKSPKVYVEDVGTASTDIGAGGT